MKFHLTRKSSNSKTGPIPVSTSPESTCPNRCPLKDNGCYADGGPLAIHWKKVSQGDRGHSWLGFLQAIKDLPKGQLWRHNQAGDLISTRAKGRISKKALVQLTHVNQGKHGFTYTHYEVLKQGSTGDWNRDAIHRANTGGFTVNLSADSLEEADKLYKLDIGPVTTTLPSSTTAKKTETPAGNTVITCLAAIRDDKTCESCMLCAAADRKAIIGFPSHGARKKIIDRMLLVMEELSESN